MTSVSTSKHQLSISSIRNRCVGVLPLQARLQPWMEELCADSQLSDLVQQYGSPLNVLCPTPLQQNIESLGKVAASKQVDLQVHFARKANKCLAFVAAADEIGAGIDVASQVELEQALQCRVDPERIICTAAVKDRNLLTRCLSSRVVIALDNEDELRQTAAIARDAYTHCPVALRVGGFEHDGEKLDTRFGFDVSDVIEMAKRFWPNAATSPLKIEGVHFHLDGYSAAQRVSAITQSLDIIDRLGQLGHKIKFLDIGGGIPMSYLESPDQWSKFWHEHDRALIGDRDPITFCNHTLGKSVVGDRVYGNPNCYPYYQELVQEDWLAEVLDADCEDRTIAQSIADRGLQLRCEPGRSVLDGCGVTVARVEFRKRHVSGDWLIGLSMNGTQCRTSSDDFLVDPLLVRGDGGDLEDPATESIEGYLVGAYCMESELLLKRKLRFPQGVAVGDLVVFPNTAGYLMHFMESRSHQFPLAKNLVVADEGLSLDTIDAPLDTES